MFRNYFSLTAALFILFTGCNNEEEYTDVDALPPTVTLTASNVKTEPGREFHLKGIIEDKDGIKSVNLKNEDLFLDKTIDLTLDSLITRYELDYKFTTDKMLVGNEFPIRVTVTDVGNRTVEETVLVTMDGNFNAPAFVLAPDAEVTVLSKETTLLNLRFEVADDKALDYVEVSVPALNYSKRITEFTNNGKTLVFADPIALPKAIADYTLTLKAVDKAALEVVKSSVIHVSEMPDFQKMYLVDVKAVANLNSDMFGIPMLIERTDAFTYKARYYSENAGTEIRFVPQKTDFSPICFGVDPNDAGKLTDEPEVSLPIVLPKRGYYSIVFNVKTGNYTVTEYTPTDAVPTNGTMQVGEEQIPIQIGLVGAGIPGAGNWSPASPLLLKQDANNPYLYSVEMTLEAGNTIEFIIQSMHPWGWWPEPFWRWNRSDDPESNVANGGENPGKWSVKKSGKYIFKFDSHLKRSKFYPVN